jgi:hypothetical protein
VSLFNCTACDSKDEHIKSLQHQIQVLEKLVLPQKRTQDLTLEEAEIDSIYNSESPKPRLDPITQEASNIITGEFDRIPSEEL